MDPVRTLRVQNILNNYKRWLYNGCFISKMCIYIYDMLPLTKSFHKKFTPLPPNPWLLVTLKRSLTSELWLWAGTLPPLLKIFYLLKKWQSDTPSMTRRKMRRKKKAPEARYKIAVVKLKETLEISDILDTQYSSVYSGAQLNNKYFLFSWAISLSLRGLCFGWNVHFIKSQNVQNKFSLGQTVQMRIVCFWRKILF